MAQLDVTAVNVGLPAIGRDLHAGITGLQCTYTGAYKADPDSRPTWNGHYSCTDGKTGDFNSTEILATAHAMSIRLAIKLTGSESCDIDAILGGSKF